MKWTRHSTASAWRRSARGYGASFCLCLLFQRQLWSQRHCRTILSSLSWAGFLKSKFSRTLVIHLTCPSLCRAVFFTLVEDRIEDHQQQEGGVVCRDSLRSAELSVIDHVQPGAEQQDPAHTVKGGLHQEEHHVDGGEGALLCPVPVYNCLGINWSNIAFSS